MDNNPFNRWTILGALVFAGFLTLVTVIAIGWTNPRFMPNVGFAPADLTMIPAPTDTPNATAVPTIDPLLVTPTIPPDTIAVGVYVQITGTEGAGLRIRAAPGLNSDSDFLGYDAEVYQVKDGPKDADGYTWWYLVAPYDSTRAGWAAANFLSVVPAPTQ
jgi:hypothetical protein